MFSDRWLHVSGLQIRIHSRVRVAAREIGGETWHMLHDPMSNEYARLRADGWRFIASLPSHRCVGEAWQAAYDRGEIGALTQHRVVQLISALYRRNLLAISTPTDSARLTERGRRRLRKPALQRAQSLLFLQIPLIDPDRALRRMAPLLRIVFGPIGLLIWALVVLLGLTTLVQRWESVIDASSAIFAAPNPILLFVSFTISKVLHELGHAGMCRRHGGAVHTLGVMLLIFAPIPYADVSSAWGFRSRAARVAVGASGMLVDAFVASLATIAWSSTPPGPVNDAAFSLMLTSAIYAFVINANPLMRFDGYYILSDLIDVPNLAAQSSAAFGSAVRTFFLGRSTSRDQDEVAVDHHGLAAFGALALGYRIFAIGGIVLFIADQYLGLGLLAAIVLTLSASGPPALRMLAAWRANRAEVSSIPGRAWLRGGVSLGLLCALMLSPLPDWNTLPAGIEAIGAQQVSTGTAGRVVEVIGRPNMVHRAGEPLVRLEDPELTLERRTIELQLVRNGMMERRALASGTADLDPIRERRRSLEQALRQTDADIAFLLVRAPADGYWAAPAIHNHMHGWVERGTELGTLIPQADHRLIAVVPQSAAARVASVADLTGTVRCSGDARTVMQLDDLRMVPLAITRLPNPALGSASGGDIAVSGHDPTGTASVEPIFQIEGRISAPDHAFLVHRRSCWVRIDLPHRSLGARWLEATRQFFQRRYRL
jgi:putative peptide zinc metalloprotease protein